MSVIAAHAVALSKSFKCGPGGAGMLVTECYVFVDEVADSLYPRPTKRRILEQPPSLVR